MVTNAQSKNVTSPPLVHYQYRSDLVSAWTASVYRCIGISVYGTSENRYIGISEYRYICTSERRYIGISVYRYIGILQVLDTLCHPSVCIYIHVYTYIYICVWPTLMVLNVGMALAVHRIHLGSSSCVQAKQRFNSSACRLKPLMLRLSLLADVLGGARASADLRRILSLSCLGGEVDLAC